VSNRLNLIYKTLFAVGGIYIGPLRGSLTVVARPHSGFTASHGRSKDARGFPKG